MTDWRTAPIRQEITRDSGQKELNTEAQPAGATAIAEILAEGNVGRTGFAGKIKALFRDAVKALTGKPPVPEPKPRRKRTTGGTGRAFLSAARKLMRRVTRGPVIQTLGLHEPELWQWNNPDVMYQTTEDFHQAETNYLFPHL